MVTITHSTRIMGILNITPDSFSGDGCLESPRELESRARCMVEHGADLLDIGGMSSRPGFQEVSEEEEALRVLPAIKQLHALFPSTPLSVDTFRPSVAAGALKVGASWVNMIYGAQLCQEMVRHVVRHKASLVLMHNTAHRDRVSSHGGHLSYKGVPRADFLSSLLQEMTTMAERASALGVPSDQILLDPGIGFGKTGEQNLLMIARLKEIRALGYPVLVGPSRKSFIGHVLNTDVEERLGGTAATVACSVQQGADVVRVHDVKEMSQVARMTEALMKVSNDHAPLDS